jgi:hypothetical protein
MEILNQIGKNLGTMFINQLILFFKVLKSNEFNIIKQRFLLKFIFIKK